MDTTLLRSYLDTIRNLTGVQSVRYVSKEMAKAEYLAEGNNDWGKVLAENPLPATIDVLFKTSDVTNELMMTFKQKIISQMFYVDDVSVPSGNYEKLKSLKESVMYLEYERF